MIFGRVNWLEIINRVIFLSSYFLIGYLGFVLRLEVLLIVLVVNLKIYVFSFNYSKKICWKKIDYLFWKVNL